MVDLATVATPATTRVIPGLQHGDKSGDCRRCNPRSWSFFGQAHAGGKAPHSHLHGLTLKPDERPPDHGKPPASKVFQRYRLAQQCPQNAVDREQNERYTRALQALSSTAPR